MVWQTKWKPPILLEFLFGVKGKPPVLLEPPIPECAFLGWLGKPNGNRQYYWSPSFWSQTGNHPCSWSPLFLNVHFVSLNGLKRTVHWPALRLLERKGHAPYLFGGVSQTTLFFAENTCFRTPQKNRSRTFFGKRETTRVIGAPYS